MLKVFICPKCFNFRIISKREHAYCLHCNMELKECRISYNEYSNLDTKERSLLRDRMKIKINRKVC